MSDTPACNKSWVVRAENGRLEATISAFGATIVSLYVADAHGKMEDVVLGHSRDIDAIRAAVADKTRNHPYFNCTVGRVCGRIGGGGRFEVDGTPVSVTANEGNGAKMLHGGAHGFNTKTWQRDETRSVADRVLCLSVVSPNGDEGFPGDLEVTATFEAVVEDDGRAGLRITYEARIVDETPATVANLTNHFYLNLAPSATLGKGGITNHTLWLDAGHYLPLDKAQLPVGVVAPVDDVMDFSTSPKRVGDRIRDVDGDVGYDHYYVFNKDVKETRKGMRKAAVVHSDESGRTMELFTTQPGVVLYTANWIEGVEGKDGVTYKNWDGMCLETQGFPDAVRWPSFPSIVLRNGDVLRHNTLLLFSAQ